MKLLFTGEAASQFRALDRRKAKKVRKTLGLMEVNLRHPSLKSHKYQSLSVDGQDVFECYVENRTPEAWRIFWHNGPGEETITIIAITPHP